MRLWRPKRRVLHAGDPWDLSATLLDWTAGAPWTIGDACMGTQIFGSTGSGKSSGSMRTICCSFLEAGFGGLFLTAKVEDAEMYRRYVDAAGRTGDLLIFSPDHPLRYNFLAEERRQVGSALGLVENLTILLMTAAELLERGSESSSGDNERYFKLEAARLARNGFLALVLSQESVTVPDLHRLIISAPQSLEQVSSEGWQKGSFCFQCLTAADKAPKSDSQRADFELALGYFLSEWPALSSRTRSVVQSTLTSATDILSRGAARDLLSSPTPNVSPSAMYEGAIIIVDLPVHAHHDVGRLVQGLLKFAWQRSHARRNISANPRPTFIVADESHYFLVDADASFQAIARSTRTATAYATQSISGMMAALGPHSEHRVHSLLGNLQTRICHQQTDIRTIEYMQQLIGRSRQFVMNGNQSRDADWRGPLFGTETGGSSGFSETWEYELQTADLNSLVKGGPPNWVTDAIVFQSGRRFPDGRTWMPVAFRQ